MKNADVKLYKDADESPGTRPWAIAVDALDLQDNTLQYHDFNKPSLERGIDFSHLWVSGLVVQGKKLQVLNHDIRGTVSNLSFRERSGFQVKKFRSDLMLSDNLLALNNFLLQTGHSRVMLAAEARFESLDSFTKNADAIFAFEIKRSVLSLKDALYFKSDLLDSLSLKRPSRPEVVIEGVIRGPVDNLNLERLQLHALSNTSLFAHGKIEGLPEIKSAVMDVRIDKFRTTRKDVQDILPDTLLPSSLELPGYVDVNGSMKGTMEVSAIAAKIRSDLGDVSMDTKLNLKSEQKQNYNVAISVEQFHLGKLLRQPQTMGVLDLDVHVIGTGIKTDELKAKINLAVNELQYKGYNYRDFKLDGSVDKYFFPVRHFSMTRTLTLR